MNRLQVKSTMAAVGLALAGLQLVQSQPAIAQSGPQAASVALLEVTIKFKDATKVADLIEMFWTDPRSARFQFDQMKSGWPAMGEAALERVTYSNELVLHFPCDETCALHRPRAIRTLVDTLSALPVIAYAKFDVRAQPQAGRP